MDDGFGLAGVEGVLRLGGRLRFLPDMHEATTMIGFEFGFVKNA